MSRTYRAILTGDRLKWTGDAPKQPHSVPVDVTVHDDRSKGSRGGDMADALGQIASRGGVASIADPAEWQREVRRDRPLPERAN